MTSTSDPFPFELSGPLRARVALLARLYPGFRATRYEARWPLPGGGETVLREFAVPSPAGIPPARIARSIAVESALDGKPLLAIFANIEALNLHAGVGALVRRAGDRKLRLVTAIVARGSSSATDPAYSLALLATQLHYEFAASSGFRVPSAADRSALLTAQDLENPWDPDEFEAAATAIESRSSSVGSAPKGLMASIATGVPEGQRDSELLIESRRRHPLLGDGLLTVLTVSAEGSLRSRNRLAARLNGLEYAGLNDFDFLGAWSARPQESRIRFTSFLPNRASLPGLVRRVATSNVSRAAWASNVISALLRGYEPRLRARD